jgi:hypothetical protein
MDAAIQRCLGQGYFVKYQRVPQDSMQAAVVLGEFLGSANEKN